MHGKVYSTIVISMLIPWDSPVGLSRVRRAAACIVALMGRTRIFPLSLCNPSWKVYM
jgi:hypothetical protein